MYQYYQDWKNYDKSIRSLWVPPKGNMKRKKHLNCQFLADWDDKSGKGLIQKWKLRREKESIMQSINKLLSLIHI